MAAQNQNKVSLPVIKRLPKYYRYISDMHNNGIVKVSSSELARMMGTTASQVRQDFNCFGGFGQQGIGYHVDVLLSEISKLLFSEKNLNAVLIGTGRLGRAISGYLSAEARGYHLMAAFDKSPDEIGRELQCGVMVQDVAELAAFCAAHHSPHAGGGRCKGLLELQPLRPLGGLRGYHGGERPPGRQPDEPGLPCAQRLKRQDRDGLTKWQSYISDTAP